MSSSTVRDLLLSGLMAISIAHAGTVDDMLTEYSGTGAGPFSASAGKALWIGWTGAEQFVASRLAHDAEALVSGIDMQTGEIGIPLPPVYSQPFSGHYYWVRFDDGRIRRSRSLWDHRPEVESIPSGGHRLGVLGDLVARLA